MNNVLDFYLDIIAHGSIGSPNRQYSVACIYTHNGEAINGLTKQYYETFKSRNEAFDFMQAVQRGEIRMLLRDWI